MCFETYRPHPRKKMRRAPFLRLSAPGSVWRRSLLPPPWLGAEWGLHRETEQWKAFLIWRQVKFVVIWRQSSYLSSTPLMWRQICIWRQLSEVLICYFISKPWLSPESWGREELLQSTRDWCLEVGGTPRIFSFKEIDGNKTYQKKSKYFHQNI